MLSKAMIRELQSISNTGEPTDPYQWAHAPGVLWFYARDKVLGALLSRGLIEDAGMCSFRITDKGRCVLP
jgi:hypothetical protein